MFPDIRKPLHGDILFARRHFTPDVQARGKRGYRGVERLYRQPSVIFDVAERIENVTRNGAARPGNTARIL